MRSPGLPFSVNHEHIYLQRKRNEIILQSVLNVINTDLGIRDHESQKSGSVVMACVSQYSEKKPPTTSASNLTRYVSNALVLSGEVVTETGGSHTH